VFVSKRDRRGCALMELAHHKSDIPGGSARIRGGEDKVFSLWRRNFPGIRDATCRECDTVAWLIAELPPMLRLEIRFRVALAAGILPRSLGRSVGRRLRV